MKARPFATTGLLAAILFQACSPTEAPPAGDLDVETAQTRIDRVLASAFPPDGPGAAVIAVQNGEVMLRKGYGLADLELGVPIQPEMVFRVASITKEFTAALVLQLVEEGAISLEDEITDFLPDYPLRGNKVTLRHLLTHTSGIPTFQAVPGFQDHVRLDHTVEETLAIFAGEPFEFLPGERYSYSSSGYIVLGAILERVTGKTFEELLQERIFGAVGMQSACLGSHDRIIPRRVKGYTVGREGVINSPIVSMTMAFSSGGLLMSVDDLAAWDEALYGDRVLGGESRKAMWSAHMLESGQATEYGLGWMVTEFLGHKVLMHDGSIDGFLSTAWRLPDDRIFVAVLTNSDSPEVGPNVAAKEVLATLLGVPENRAIPMTPAVMDRYVGDYSRRDGRIWRVVQEDGRLYLAPNERVLWEILPASASDFFFTDRLNKFNTLTFKVSDDGVVEGLVVAFDTGGQISADKSVQEDSG
jgi:CubicO group peptidase (beta-lactamase class C family)